MNALHFPLLAGLLCFIGGPTFGNSWLQRTSLPAAARAEPMSFGLNGQVYLVGGQHPAAGSAILLADCWAYDPITNSWSQKADYGGGQISTGVAFSIGSFGFVGSGAVFPGGQLWAYNPTANQWTQKASIPLGSPGLQRVSSAAFTVADKAYVCGGSDGAGYHSDLWEYDPATDTWTQRTSFPGGGRWGAIAFSANGKGYFGTGASWLNEHQDMWSYDPQNDTWVQVGNFPGGVRSYAAAFGIGTRGFVHGGKHGSGSIYNDLWEFNALNDTWTQRASNLNRYTAAATSLGDKGYFGMGLLDTGSFGTFFNDWWEYTPDPQLDCLGVPNGTALPGTSCDDGNASTTNDVLGSNCICAGTPSTNSWVQRADFGGGQRGGGFSFALAGKGFVGGGSNSGGTSFNDHWAYDPTTNTWSQMASLPVTGATGGLGFSIGGNGYVYVTEVNALWAYDPNTNSWIERAAFPGGPRFRPFGFALDAYGYMGGGFSYGPWASMNDFWRYDPSSDSWLQRADLSGVARSGSASFTVDGLGYVFGGADDAFNVLGDLQAYDPVANSWNSRSPLPSIGRRGATGFSIGHAGYVAGGSTSSFIRLNECWEYQPGNNLWNAVAAPGPEGREVGMAFTIGMQGYLVGGYAGGANTTFADMRMYTQNPQPDCNGVVGGTNYPGTPCDDGNATTTNDVFDANCMCTGTNAPDAWVQRADFGGGQRAGGFSFTLAGAGYVGGGNMNEVTPTSDVWAFDPLTNAWSQVASLPVTANAGSLGFTIGSNGYVFAAQGNDLWAYDPVGNAWSARTTLPASGRFRPFGFALGAYGYVGGGRYGSTSLSDFWRYDPVSDAWLQRADIPGPARWVGASFAVDGIGYIFGGADDAFNDLNDLQAFNPATNTWSPRAPMPGTARRAASGFSIGHAGYVAGGSTAGNLRFNECWEYQPGNNLWNQVADPGPEARSSAMAFTIGDHGYVVGGFTGDATTLTADMRMYTQNPQPDCNGVIGGTNYPGTPCDDGLAYTGNDALNGLCICRGTCLNDADSDGICDEVDNCPLLPGVSGTPCDDGNPCTVDDQLYLVFGGNCTCTGYYADSDNDGVCDAQDNCPAVPGQQGDACDDGNANTTNDVITAACTCAGTPVSNDAWIQQADFTGFPRANAIAFTIGSYGYMGTGEDATSLFQDLWRYDATSDSWSQMADIDVPRTGAYAFAIGDFGYVGDGNDQNALHIADLRRYDPASNSWTWLFAFSPGGQGRYRAVAFSANGKGYMGSGQNTFGPTDDFWEFDPVTFNWAQMPNMPGGQRSLATAFAIGNKGYAGTGSSGPGVVLNDFYEFDALTLTWSPKSNFGGTARGSAVSFALASKGYIGTGQDGSGTLQDFWEYDPTADTWTQRAPLPGPQRLAASAFTVDGRAYVSMGSNSNGVLGDVWEYTPAGVTCTVGAPCDDGLAYTQNDTLTANCSCAGACISDLDLDGLCDEVDPCPYQSLPVGSACDDFNACTENDVVQPWCGCAGTPLPDGDSDGICDLLDQCPSSPGSIGYACDDGNPCTANDVIDANCVCAGQIPDANNDGLSDLCNPYVMQTATSGCSTYMLLSQSNWTNAEAAAVALGGHLATINDASENNFIFTTFSNNLSVDRGLWIGLNDATNEGQFEWSSGEPVTYSQWAPGEPNNDDGNEDYVHLFWQSVPVAASWNDYKYDAIAFDGIPIHGVVEIPTVDTDNDGICDLQDNCPTIPGMIGSTCDDGNACTLNDVLDANCQCIGTPLICDDGNVCNGVETCVAGVCVAGIALNCDDGNPCTINSCDPLLGCTQLNVPDGTSCGVNTQCLSGVCTPIIACDTWTLEFATDNTGSESTWQIINANTLAVIGSGGPYASTTTTTASVCIPASACYRLRVTDANGMSNGTTGGFVLRDNTGKRVLDNANDGVFTGISQAVAPFCSPVGNDGLIASQCDKVDWLPGGLLIASQNSAVSAQYGVGNQSDDGYEFRIFNPDGGYDRTVFISHANPVPGAATGATAACYLGFSSLQTNPVPQNVLLNVRVRSAVNGVFSAWGPACRFKIDATSANCPTTKLITTPGSTFSCGATGKVVNASGASGRIYAQPVTRPVGGVNQAANAYLFELTNTANNYIRVIGTSSYTLVLGKWYTDPLLCGTHTYTVRVRVSFDGGATYCPWGASCTVGITNNFTSPFCTTPAGNLCGNGVMNPGETCDDGNQVNGDGCDNNCQPTGSATAYNTDRVFFDGDGNDTSSELNLWPNPNDTEQLHVTINALNAEVTTATVDIFDLVGHKVGTHTIPVNGSTLNTVIALDASMANGMYLVNVTAGDQTFVQRLVIQ